MTLIIIAQVPAEFIAKSAMSLKTKTEARSQWKSLNKQFSYYTRRLRDCQNEERRERFTPEWEKSLLQFFADEWCLFGLSLAGIWGGVWDLIASRPGQCRTRSRNSSQTTRRQQLNSLARQGKVAHNFSNDHRVKTIARSQQHGSNASDIKDSSVDKWWQII